MERERNVLANLEPKEVFYYFEEICAIPHGSFHTKQLSDYCVEFARGHNLSCCQDKANNVIIKKEATPGYEAAPPVIIQGHLDMVCEKEAGCPIDFEKDGLSLQVDGDLISAKGTTLGGDDGIAVAYALAILASDQIAHPKLEVVLTSDEEVGMLGAEAIDLSLLEGRILINIDSEEEGIFLASCAGGLRANIVLPVSRIEAEGTGYEVSLDGMSGGHSGSEIHKGRANANKLLSRLLYEAGKEAEFGIMSMSGGQKDNAIPRSSKASLLVNHADCEAFEAAVKKMGAVFQKEYKKSDPGLVVSFTKTGGKKALVLDQDSQKRTFLLLLLLPDGVQTMSRELPGLVETSLNLGVMELGQEELKLSSAVRSSVGTAKVFLSDQLNVLTESVGGTMETAGDYPAWEFQEKSHIREIFAGAYRDLFSKEPQIQAIHAGLECGLFSDKLPGLDCVSIGPDMSGVHTTEEQLSAASAKRTWELLIEVLKRLKE